MNHLQIILCLSVFYQSFGQTDNFTLGARSASMANAISTLEDEWSTFNNVAGLANIKNSSVLVSHQNQYGLNELSVLGAGAIVPTQSGVIGLSLYRFGDISFSKQKIGIGFANKFGIASLGLRVNYIQFNIDSYGTKKTVSFDFGGITELTPHLTFGAYIFNLSQQKLAQFENERLPTIMQAGLSYKPTKKLITSIEVQKNIDFNPSIRAGLEYAFLEKFSARTGISTRPFKSFFGLGFDSRKLNIDYAYNNQSFLGNAHQLSLGYRIKTDENK